MSVAGPLLLGFLMGLRHAADPDHVAAIAAIVSRTRAWPAAVRAGVIWGAGHTAVLVGIGALLVGGGVLLPPAVATFAEWAVALMLIVLGLAALGGAPRRAAPPARWLRPFVVGLVHGLAGSAPLALLALATLESRAGAVAYLVLFGAGTIAGMGAISFGLAIPLAWSSRRNERFGRTVAQLAGALSVATGLVLLVKAAS
jgi:high-affinity nickel-transport protein